MIGMDSLAAFSSGQELSSKQTRIAMALAVAVHLGTFLIGIFSPYLLHQRSKITDVYTVNLVAVTEPAGRPAPKPQVREQPAPAPLTKVAKTAAPEIKTKPEPTAKKTAKPTAKPAPVPPKTAISTRPIRHKTSRDLKAIESIRKQLLSEQEAEKAAEAARKARLKALAAIKQSLHSEPRPTIDISAKTSDTMLSAPTNGSSGEQMVDEAKRQYFASIYEKIKAHFILPDLKNWNTDLQSILVIDVRKDGIVTKSFFEQKSDNIFFNQAVERALRDAGAMPPFPAALKESHLEFGLRFRPGDLL